MDGPLNFEAFLRPMVWGGRRLAELLGKRLPSDEPYGESWEISDHATHSSRVDRGPLAGQTLRDLMRQHRQSLLGAVVLAAEPASRIFAGLKPGVDEPGLREALRRGSVADCLHSFTPRPGDCLFLKAGTVHAVGGGVLMAEVQQTSDATFRLFDWNRVAQGRSRPLHVDQALACINWHQGPIEPIRVPAFEEPPSGPAERRCLVECDYFTLDYLHGGEPVTCGGGRLQLLTVVRGEGRLVAGGAAEELAPGQTWLLPAAAGEVWLEPRGGLGVLLSTLPDGHRLSAFGNQPE
ncbi:MAG: class I mannose-6-phosphate isomerase [Planctomycetes bacterium]|nr:class I mannose-6-phosphate isomerase [Planctomycetota bacterium]